MTNRQALSTVLSPQRPRPWDLHLGQAMLSKSARKRTQASRRDRDEVETKVVETITETDLKRCVTLRKVEEAP